VDLREQIFSRTWISSIKREIVTKADRTNPASILRTLVNL